MNNRTPSGRPSLDDAIIRAPCANTLAFAAICSIVARGTLK